MGNEISEALEAVIKPLQSWLPFAPAFVGSVAVVAVALLRRAAIRPVMLGTLAAGAVFLAYALTASGEALVCEAEDRGWSMVGRCANVGPTFHQVAAFCAYTGLLVGLLYLVLRFLLRRNNPA